MDAIGVLALEREKKVSVLFSCIPRFNLRTVAYWSAGMTPQRSSVQKLKEVTRLFDALSDIIKASAIGPWLQRPNKQFDGSTPLQVMERGESDRLWRMIWQLREGTAG
jgi:hypothetical protein